MAVDRVAVLDDYQQVALGSAGWGPVTSRAEVTVFTAPFGSPDEAAAALKPFTVIAAMRERSGCSAWAGSASGWPATAGRSAWACWPGART